MNYCCAYLQEKVEFTCPEHGEDCDDKSITKYPNGGIGIKLPSSVGGGMIAILFCPWCGQSLKSVHKVVRLDPFVGSNIAEFEEDT